MKAYSAILVFAFIACAFADYDYGPSHLCDKPPDSILERLVAEFVEWPKNRTPEEDYLDHFMIDETGCAYRALGSGRHYKVKRKFNETLDLKFAVRGYFMQISVSWQTPSHLVNYYLLGRQALCETNTLAFNSHGWTPKEVRVTPGIIAENKYTPFYIKIDASTIKFGKICDTEPSFQPFTRDISIDNKERVEIKFVPHSTEGYGAAVIVC